jgi:hypothetical protein
MECERGKDPESTEFSETARSIRFLSADDRRQESHNVTILKGGLQLFKDSYRRYIVRFHRISDCWANLRASLTAYESV